MIVLSFSMFNELTLLLFLWLMCKENVLQCHLILTLFMYYNEIGLAYNVRGLTYQICLLKCIYLILDVIRNKPLYKSGNWIMKSCYFRYLLSSKVFILQTLPHNLFNFVTSDLHNKKTKMFFSLPPKSKIKLSSFNNSSLYVTRFIWHLHQDLIFLFYYIIRYYVDLTTLEYNLQYSNYLSNDIFNFPVIYIEIQMTANDI